MIGETLNLKGDSIVHVMMPRQTAEESEKAHKEITSRIMDEYYPELTGHITKQQIVDKAHQCKTIEELETLRYDLVPDNFYQFLVDKLNAEESLNDSERIFLLSFLADRIVFSSKQYINGILHERAQVIAAEMRKGKNKIIIP